MEKEYCAVAYCDRVAEVGHGTDRLRDIDTPLCGPHWKQMKYRGRTRPLAERPRDGRERLEAAALALRDADSEDDAGYRLARRRFWDAVHDLMATWKRPGTPGRRIHKSVADE